MHSWPRDEKPDEVFENVYPCVHKFRYLTASRVPTNACSAATDVVLAVQTPWSRLPAKKTNTFTLIQLACLGSMM